MKMARVPVDAAAKAREHPLTFVACLRRIADGEIDAAEACRSYHAELGRLRITPRRSLEEDLQLTSTGGPEAGAASGSGRVSAQRPRYSPAK